MRTRLRVRWRERRWGYRRFRRLRPIQSRAGGPVRAGGGAQAAYGTFLLKLDRLSPTLHDSFAQYRRTYRVFDENGRLMIEPLVKAGAPLKQADGSFMMRSSPRTHISFVLQDGRALAMKMDGQGFGVLYLEIASAMATRRLSINSYADSDENEIVPLRGTPSQVISISTSRFASTTPCGLSRETRRVRSIVWHGCCSRRHWRRTCVAPTWLPQA